MLILSGLRRLSSSRDIYALPSPLLECYAKPTTLCYSQFAAFAPLYPALVPAFVTLCSKSMLHSASATITNMPAGAFTLTKQHFPCRRTHFTALSTGFHFLCRHNTLKISVFVNVSYSLFWLDELSVLLYYQTAATGRNFHEFGYLHRYEGALISKTGNTVVTKTFGLETTPRQLCKASLHSFSSILVPVADTYVRLDKSSP